MGLRVPFRRAFTVGAGETAAASGLKNQKRPFVASLHTYAKETVEHVLAAMDIVDVIGGQIELKAAGAGRFKALCPFHQEKTPSFHVSRDRQHFYCFGCEKGGDAITFLREYLGLSFVEALQKLADKAGIALPTTPERSKESSKRAQLLELSRFAGAFYTETLNDPRRGSPGRQYLETRQLRDDIVTRFRLGYAPESWSALADAARQKKFSEAILLDSGLVKRSDRGRPYDFFRNRVIFPIRDVSGNVVAFGGRTLGDSPAKYINSPENALYKKSRVLYGLFESRDAIRREKSLILVEGYFDLLRCVDAGVENVVATCGTALTPEQAALMRRYAPEVTVVYDGDKAGIRAALRSVGILCAAGLTVKALVLPDGQDPDDFVRAQGGDAFRAMIAEASDFFQFYIRMSADRLTSIEGRTEVSREVFELVAEMDDPLRQEQYVKQMATDLGLQYWTLWAEFQKSIQQGNLAREQRRAVARDEDSPRQTPISHDDVVFVALLTRHPNFVAQAHTDLGEVGLPDGPLGEVLVALREGAGPEAVHRISGDAAKRLYSAASMAQPPEGIAPETVFNKRIARIKWERLRAEAARLTAEIRKAERANDQTRVGELLTQKLAVDKRIQKVGAA